MAVISDYSINNRYKDKKKKKPPNPPPPFSFLQYVLRAGSWFWAQGQGYRPHESVSTVSHYTADASDNIVPY